MAAWAEFEADAAEFAARVKARFDSGTNKTIATIRRDGSPRISGTELVIDELAVRLGVMPGSKKLADIQRDPRVAIHSPTLEPPANPTEWAGEAKLSGRLEKVGEDGGHHFLLDITEVVHTAVAATGDRLVIESWHPGRGYQRTERQ